MKLRNILILLVILLGVIRIGQTIQNRFDGVQSQEENSTQGNLYTGGTYQAYEEAKLESLSGNIVLFFHADWCPLCIAAEKSFLESGMPEGLHILKVDFDTATELKKKYTVLSQTSFVRVNPDGSMIKRRIGGTRIEDILDKIQESNNLTLSSTVDPTIPTGEIRKAYFAGGCFRCMEGPFESLNGVQEVINGYIGGTKESADYIQVSSGKTKHREAVEVTYDASVVSYQDLLNQYWRQIDPTDDGGQFADRGYQYTTAIYYANDEEKAFAEASKQKIQDSKQFNDKIVVQILPAVAFYPAEEYHQDYYKKNSEAYGAYKKGSGREDFIDQNWKTDSQETPVISRKQKKPKDISELTDEQRRILFEGGTETPFNNAYWDNKEAGIYVDVIDGTPLFSSLDKFDSGTGWPSFTKPISDAMVVESEDNRLLMKRTAITSTSSSGSLGHVFNDAPAELGGVRYCINSAALEFIPVAELEQRGYADYLSLFNK